MPKLFTIASLELIVARRNMWVATAVVLMALFSIVLATAGNASADDLGVDPLAVTIASLTTMSVYLVPLIALLLSYDAIAGERERGSLALLFCYPIGRGEILAGKFAAHGAILAFAIGIGFSAAAAYSISVGEVSAQSLFALARLFASAVLLGATFLAAGYIVSSVSAQSSAAAGIVIAVWMVFVVLYDLALLGGLVVDDSGSFTTDVFPWLLVANPADAFRTFNFLGSEMMETASGLIGAPEQIPAWVSGASLIIWPLAMLTIAWRCLRMRAP